MPLQEKKSTLKIVRNDPWLEPYKEAIHGRYAYARQREAEFIGGGKLADFADAHLVFGLHKTPEGWTFREWAPNATAVYLIGDFNQWTRQDAFKLQRLENGVWEINLAATQINHGQLYKLYVEWPGGAGERIPAYATRVLQDLDTRLFSCQVWEPETPYVFKHKRFKPDTSPLLIYECHIGMAQEGEKVGTYDEFRRLILPHIAKAGYNAIQIMAMR